MDINEREIGQLPRSVKWSMGGWPVTMKFEQSGETIHQVSPQRITNCDLKPDWDALYVLGEMDFIESGAYKFVCVREPKKDVVVLDPACDDTGAVITLNNSLAKFVETFKFFDVFLNVANVCPLPRCSVEELRQIDQEAENGFWGAMCDHVFEEQESE